MDQVDLSVFADSYSIVALIDSDPKSNKVRKRFQEKCQGAGIPVHKLKGYAIENYFSLHALKKVFNTQISDEISEIKLSEKLEKQIGLNVKNNNRKLARAMELEEIADTDLMKFFELVQSKLPTLS